MSRRRSPRGTSVSARRPGAGPRLDELERLDEFRWQIPRTYKPGMHVPGIVYASEAMLRRTVEAKALEQIANVACLPGIVRYALAMPDIHWGYGFPVGGVAATDARDGVISPGGIGFDINCGVRLLRSDLTESDLRRKLPQLMERLFAAVPAGVGSTGRVKLDLPSVRGALRGGAGWAVERGFGRSQDLDVIEDRGTFGGADPAAVSDRALQRGAVQLGTLGSGNHFLEIQVVDAVFDAAAARTMGIDRAGNVVVFVHTGSRGCGHQICQDYLDRFARSDHSREIPLPDRQLACAPLTSPEGRDYLSAMACGANFAWANRQIITDATRRAFAAVFGKAAELELVYDVAHNIAKVEHHAIDGVLRRLCVHRKGATRAFPPGHPAIPLKYRDVGQPVLIPGDMGRYSYVAVGTARALEESFGSTCHGAGRQLSRTAARRRLRGVDVAQRLLSRGIQVRAHTPRLLAEEASEAYKDVADVTAITEGAGISHNVARLRSVGVIKG